MKIKRSLKFGLRFLRGYKIQGVGFILTRRCNLDCEYCKIKNDKNKKELVKEQWVKIIDNFVKNKHCHFIFTGGEPLLYESVYELIDYASKKAITSLITNTSYLNQETFPKLKNLDFLTFSCDSLGENMDFKKNTLPKAELIKNWSKKLNIKPSAIITVTSKNIKEVPMIIKQLNKYKISVLLSLIHSSNKDVYEFRNYVPHLEFKTEGEINTLINLQNKLLEMKKMGYKILECDDFIKNMVSFVRDQYKIKCPATNPFFTIDCDGYIKPCHDIPASEVNAIDFENYNEMRKEVAKKIPKDCNCYFDCYFNNQNKIKNLVLQALKR